MFRLYFEPIFYQALQFKYFEKYYVRHFRKFFDICLNFVGYD